MKRYSNVIDTESDTDIESDIDNNNKDDDLFDACMKIYETKKGLSVTDGHAFALMITEFQKYGVTAEDYAAAIDAMSKDPKYKRANKPTSPKSWAIGYAEDRNNPVRPRKNHRKSNQEIVKEMIESGEI